MAVPYTFLKKKKNNYITYASSTNRRAKISKYNLSLKHITEIKRKKVIKIKNTVIS